MSNKDEDPGCLPAIIFINVAYFVIGFLFKIFFNIDVIKPAFSGKPTLWGLFVLGLSVTLYFLILVYPDKKNKS